MAQKVWESKSRGERKLQWVMSKMMRTWVAFYSYGQEKKKLAVKSDVVEELTYLEYC